MNRNPGHRRARATVPPPSVSLPSDLRFGGILAGFERCLFPTGAKSAAFTTMPCGLEIYFFYHPHCPKQKRAAIKPPRFFDISPHCEARAHFNSSGFL